MDSFSNFPQSFEPVNSDSILEQFLELKSNVKNVDSQIESVNEKADSALAQVATKQEKLVAGNNITIDGNVISATGDLSATWGNITGNIEQQDDLNQKFNSINTEITGINQIVDNLQDDLNQKFNSINTEITGINQIVDNLQDDVTTLTEEYNTFKQQVETFIDSIYDKIFTENSIIIRDDDTDPAELYGGRWVLIEDKFLLGAGNKYTLNETGGFTDATLVSHNHDTNVPGIGQASFVYSGRPVYFGKGSTSGAGYVVSLSYTNTTGGVQANLAWNGLDATNKNMPPYLAVKIWRRMTTEEIEQLGE